VRSGRPFRHVDDPSEGAPFFKALIPTLHIVNLEGSRRAAGLLVGDAQRDEPRRVLDVGCGSAVWSIAIAERGGPRTRVVAQDLPSVLETTREYVRLHHVEDQYEFLAGDQRQLDLGEGLYDIVVIARYLHELAPRAAADLLGRSFRALKSGGTISIADWMPNAERTGPLSPLVYALRMLLHTEEGNAHTAEEYEEWLRAAGFVQIRRTPDVGWDVPLILAVRP
jgi:ubiquinone/menaquinone biosynthesis C-methylase UbiE